MSTPSRSGLPFPDWTLGFFIPYLTSSHHMSLLQYMLKMILNEMLMNVVMPFFLPFNAKYSATAPQKRKYKPPHAAVSRCSLLSTCEGVPIYKHLLLGCANAGMFQPVLLNLPFTPLRTEQYHIPDFCSHWQKTSDWSSWILLTGSNRNFSTLAEKTTPAHWSCTLK